MEIARAGKTLPDQFRSGYRAIACHQAAIGLMRKKRLPDPGHRQGISDAGDQRKDQGHEDRGPDLFEHRVFPPPSPVAVTARSISLMPMKGTTRPPRP